MDRREASYLAAIFLLIMFMSSVLIGAFFFDFKLLTKEVADKSDLTIEVIRERVIKNRPEILAKTSHLENSFEILCFGARKLNNVTNIEERKSLMQMVNYEWNQAKRVSISLYSDMTHESDLTREEKDILGDKLELKKSPLNVSEKLPESIEELAEKIDFLHKVLGANSASAVVKFDS